MTSCFVVSNEFGGRLIGATHDQAGRRTPRWSAREGDKVPSSLDGVRAAQLNYQVSLWPSHMDLPQSASVHGIC